MAARTQNTCYPQQALSVNSAIDPPMCKTCNSVATQNRSCYTSDNGSSPCGQCNSCNTVCDSVQSYCSLGVQLISDHGSVGASPYISCTSQGQTISLNWTAQYWNSLIDNLDTAGIVGRTSSQGTTPYGTKATSDPNNCINHPANSLITASKYNEMVNKINWFNGRIQSVNQNAVILGAHAAALENGYSTARFNSNVCDICNAQAQVGGICPCNCSCACDCGCACPCPCQCPCSCPMPIEPT